MWRWAIVLIIALAGSLPLSGQEDFASPIQGEIQLTGTFGELRGNHFHLGLDIRGGIGVPIYSIGDGYVYRIRVESGGYGQAIYVRHPNGYTSIYAHLDQFADKIAAFVQTRQYAEESFFQDITFGPEQFPVSRGEQIAYMGTRGYSFGPHLHLEIHRTASDVPVNPLAFGFRVADSKPPELRQLRVYRVQGRGDTEMEKTLTLRAAGAGRYTLPVDTLRTEAATIGLAIKAFDRMDKLSNLNGIHALRMEVDDSLHFAFRFDAIPYRETRFLNAHLDYADQQRSDSWFHRCFRLPGNYGSFYDYRANRGVLRLRQNQPRKVRIIVTDFARNTSEITFMVVRAGGDDQPVITHQYNYLLPFDERSIIDNGHFRLEAADTTFYQDLYLDYDRVTDSSNGIYSDVHHLGPGLVPFHRPVTIAIRPTTLPPQLRDKAYIARCEGARTLDFAGGTWQPDGRLTTRIRSMGDYCIMVDTIPPTIDPFDFSENMRGKSQMRFRAKDNLTTIDYHATVDGQWILLEYDAKNRLLIHQFDERIAPGTHQLRLTVTDELGNSRELVRSFRR